jgi:hypothetical protein
MIVTQDAAIADIADIADIAVVTVGRVREQALFADWEWAKTVRDMTAADLLKDAADFK